MGRLPPPPPCAGLRRSSSAEIENLLAAGSSVGSPSSPQLIQQRGLFFYYREMDPEAKRSQFRMDFSLQGSDSFPLLSTSSRFSLRGRASLSTETEDLFSPLSSDTGVYTGSSFQCLLYYQAPLFCISSSLVSFSWRCAQNSFFLPFFICSPLSLQRNEPDPLRTRRGLFFWSHQFFPLLFSSHTKHVFASVCLSAALDLALWVDFSGGPLRVSFFPPPYTLGCWLKRPWAALFLAAILFLGFLPLQKMGFSLVS